MNLEEFVRKNIRMPKKIAIVLISIIPVILISCVGISRTFASSGVIDTVFSSNVSGTEMAESTTSSDALYVFKTKDTDGSQITNLYTNDYEDQIISLYKTASPSVVNITSVAYVFNRIIRFLDADVNFKIAKDFTNRVKEKALGQNVLTTLNPGQLMIKIVKDELTELMGGETVGINLKGSPTVILMSGLQGSGKTTFSGKLANYLKTKKTKQVLHYMDKTIEDEKKFFTQEDVNLLCVENGILNLKTREIIDFEPYYKFFDKIPVKYTPDKECPAIIHLLQNYRFLNLALIY